MTKIILQRKECIGCQACISVAEKYFKYNEEDNKVDLKDAKGKDIQELELKDDKDLKMLKQAEDICPIDAIKVE